MSGKLNIIMLTADPKVARDLQERTKSFASEVNFLPCGTYEKIIEYRQKVSFDAAIVDDTFPEPLASTTMTRLRKALDPFERSTHPVFLLSAERDTATLRTILAAGFYDIFTKPVDAALFFQKLQIYFPQTRFLKENLLFSMNVGAELDLALECRVVNFSEFGVSFELKHELSVGEVYRMYGAMYGARSGDCMGRVLFCRKRAGDNPFYDAGMVFIAPTKEVLSVVRLWMKHEYIRLREAKG